jgi:hypothetical protein
MRVLEIISAVSDDGPSERIGEQLVEQLVEQEVLAPNGLSGLYDPVRTVLTISSVLLGFLGVVALCILLYVHIASCALPEDLFQCLG